MNKLVCLLFLYSICIFHSKGQSIFPKIEETFQMLDSTAYVDKALQAECKSRWSDIESINKCYVWNKERIANTRAVFILNIDIDSTLVDSGNFIKLDTSEYNFTLFFFDKKLRIKNNLCFLNNEIYPFYPEYVDSVIYSRNFPGGYKKVLKRNPKYILWCFRLTSTILYVPEETEDKILVYNIWNEKTYELEEYLEKIRNTDESAPDSYQYKYQEGPLEEIGAW